MLGLIMNITLYAFVILLIYLAIMFFIGGIKIIQSDKSTYSRNHKATGGFVNAIKGTLSTKTNGIRNYNVVAGLAYNKKTKQLESQGSLSNKAIENILIK